MLSRVHAATHDMKPRLFISHASNHEGVNPRVVEVRKHLVELLRGDWDVFLDSHSLKPGQRWRPEILANLARAQAAVVLFDKVAAKESRWVSAESMVLCFKKSLDSSFQLLPVLFDGITLQQTALGQYEPFGLFETLARFDDDASTPLETAERIKGDLRPEEALRSQSESTWTKDVTWRLKDVRQPLVDAAQALEIDVDSLTAAPETWGSMSETARRALGQRLHEHRCLAQCVGAIRYLMGPMSRDERSEFSRYVYAKWVPNQAVETLLRATRDRNKLGLLGLNAPEADIFEHYAARVGIEAQPKIVNRVSVSDATGDDDESMVSAVIDTMKRTLFKRRLPLDPQGEPMSTAAAIADLIVNQERIVLCSLPVRFGRPGVLGPLRRDFASVNFVLTSRLSDSSRLLTAGAAVLKPELTPATFNDLIAIETGLDGMLTAKEDQP
jgi:hypothetical protein